MTTCDRLLAAQMRDDEPPAHREFVCQGCRNDGLRIEKCANTMSCKRRPPARLTSAPIRLQPANCSASASASAASQPSLLSFNLSPPPKISHLLMINTILLAVIHAGHQVGSSLQFGSSRYFYPQTWPSSSSSLSPILPLASRHSELTARSGAAQVPSQRDGTDVLTSNNKTDYLLASMHGQLNELRRRVALAAEQCQMTLGSPCSSAKDCGKSIENSHCKLDNFTCACLPYHVEFNSTKCVPAKLLGQQCLIDAQCQRKVQDSYCSAGICTCHAEFVSYRKDKCLPASKINDFCLTDSQCQLADKHSHCKWRIPNVYGHCKCPPNYKHITSAETKSIGCAPRLGDSCLDSSECLLATNNSDCREPRPGQLGTTWRTSSAGTRKCSCADGYLESANKLECLLDTARAVSTTLPSLLSAVSLMDAKHHYDFVIGKGGDNDSGTTSNYAATAADEFELGSLAASQSVGAVVVAAPVPSPTTPPLTSKNEIVTTEPPTTTTARDSNVPRMSSLGKRCKSRLECQLRDPYTDCINGRCECLAPTPSCSSNSTGCHKDTFQCRNGQCISWYFVCDGVKNCDDATDEDECQRDRCPREAFQCDDGACLARSQLCNGKAECADGSDESRCAGGASQCDPRAFTCANGQCLPAHVLCNAVEDCLDGSDEDVRLCDRLWPHSLRPQQQPQLNSTLRSQLGALSLVRNQQQQQQQETVARLNQTTDSPLVKANRLAMDQMLAALNLLPSVKRTRAARLVKLERREGERWRAAGSFHKPTTITTTTQVDSGNWRRRQPGRLGQKGLGECPRSAFTCRNGKCRSSAVLCSGVDGCGDNSDENRCQVCQCRKPPA